MTERGEGMQPRKTRRTLAVIDVLEGARLRWLWGRLAVHDIKMRYRGSVIGPFWLTLTTAIMTAALGVLYAKLFKMEISDFLPFISVGLIVWQFVSGTVNEACVTFVAVAAEIEQVRLPFFCHVFRLVYRNLLVFAHNATILPVVLLIFPPHLAPGLLWTIPLALLVLTVNAIWVACLLGMVGARYRDLPPIIANFLQVLFFITPIFWKPEALGNRAPLAQLNPLAAAIDIVRAPILGAAPAAPSWLLMIAITLVGSVVTFAVFVRFRARIAYWV